MDADHSKNALAYRQIRRALQSGRYLPGQRIDPAESAALSHTSPTPVRFALYRLVGEGLVADHARAGMYVPLPTELGLRVLFDWMEKLLLLACDIGFEGHVATRAVPAVADADVDTVKSTWLLFDAIARAADHRPLHEAVRLANDRLAPVRRAMHLHGVVPDPSGELQALQEPWFTRDVEALRPAIADYHEHRKQWVPRIVALLNETREYPN